MADKIKETAELSHSGAMGMFHSLLDSVGAEKPSSSSTSPATFAGANVPQGKIVVEAKDADLAKKFVSSSSDFDVKEKVEPEKDMDLFTWYLLTKGNNGSLDGMSDSDIAQDFANLVKSLGLEDTKVNFGGKEVTLGELSKKLSSAYEGDDFPMAGYPAGILGQARLASSSPLTAKALAEVERLANDKGVLGAIQTASRIVGVDTTYMLLKAKQESGFNSNAHAKTSSAGGLYQFLDSTWVATTHKHKDLLEKQMGIDVDHLSRGQLLALKNNAMASALMGAAFAKDNKDYLERHVNIPGGFHANSSALYMAHFLGPAGAEKFFEGLARNPSASAASLFPQAAAANASVFGGKSLADLGNWAAHKVGGPAYTIFS